MNEQESLERAIDEAVEICSHDPRWPSLFEAERQRLLQRFPGEFVAIEHFGSTAVPGLAAKPIIDLLAGVTSMAQADALMAPLCESGYATSMEFNASLDGRRWLMRWAAGRRTHHLHLMIHDSEEWQRRLAFRDLLRTDAALADRYAQLKRRCAARFRSDREAYTAAKADFVREALQAAT